MKVNRGQGLAHRATELLLTGGEKTQRIARDLITQENPDGHGF